MFHLSCSLEEGNRSETACCENRRFLTALKFQIVLVSLLVTFAAALFCLPAKNAYAEEITVGGVCYTKTATIDGVTYTYEDHATLVDEGYIGITEISSD